MKTINVRFGEYHQGQKRFIDVTPSSYWYSWIALMKEKFRVNSSLMFPQVLILFFEQSDFYREDCLNALANNYYRKNQYIPIISIGNFRFEEVEELGKAGLEYDNRLKYLDSSIWNRYFSIDEVFDENALFGSCLNRYRLFYDKEKWDNPWLDLIKTNITKEYVELNGRKLYNSYLERFGGHAKYIRPFIFHSEGEMKRKYLEKYHGDLNFLEWAKANNIHWKLLLLDDHIGNEPLSPYDEKRTGKHDHLTADRIVKELLEEDGWQVERRETGKVVQMSDKGAQIELVAVASVQDAVELLKKETFDIILLDYLLGYDEEGRREMGDELLKKIKENRMVATRSNPLSYYWLMLTSAFPESFFDRLREQGISYNSEFWHLFRGATPINTPELFRFSLYGLMKLQIAEASFSKGKIAGHFRKRFTIFSQGKRADLRSWAKSYYQVFISKFGKIHLLKDSSTSWFSNSYSQYFINQRSEDLAYYERMKNFLYLLANGTYHEASQMQISYLGISKEIEWSRDSENGITNQAKLEKYIRSFGR
ncbi:MAG: response regulator [Marinifilaceae bacterium]